MPHLTPSPYYITIVDSEGGINMADNSVVPVSHRVFVDKYEMIGYESLRKSFGGDMSALRAFLIQCLEQPSGMSGRFSWERK